MKQALGRALAVGAVLVCVSASSHGAAPTAGVYTTHFDGTLAVWDISGSYAQDVLGGSLSADVVVSEDAKGKLTGDGTATYASDIGDVVMNFTISGTVVNAAGVVAVMLVEKFQGTATVDGTNHKFNGTFNYDVTVNTLAATLDGEVTGSICAGGRCASIEQLNDGQPLEVSMALPNPNMDGSWDLDIAILSVNGTKVLATATVTLSNGRTLTMTGRGKYSPTTDLTTLTFKGSTSDSKGNQLKLKVQGADLSIVSMTGKLFGQKPTIMH